MEKRDGQRWRKRSSFWLFGINAIAQLSQLSPASGEMNMHSLRKVIGRLFADFLKR